MAFTYLEKTPGELIRSADWNAVGMEVARLGGDKVDRAGGDTINGSLGVRGDFTVGAANKGAGLRIFKKQEDGTAADHGAVVLGTDGDASARLHLGYAGPYSWIQSQGKPTLALNPRGGSVGVGTEAPQDRLHVHGALRILSDSNPVRFTSGWSGFPDAAPNQAEIANDTGTYKTLMLVGNRSAGGPRRVSVWDRLEVNGTLAVTGDAGVGGAFSTAGAATVGGRLTAGGGAAVTGPLSATGDASLGANATVGGALSFGERGGQHVNLWRTGYGIGIQGSTQYYRSDAHFAWFRGGAHHNDTFNPGPNGAALMVLRADGALGVGTATPAARLHVAGGAIRVDAGQELMFADNGQIRSADDNHRILFRRSENKLELREHGDIVFSPGATAGAETARMVVNAAGSVGIGTAAPQDRLDVAGRVRIGSNASPIQIGGDGHTGFVNGNARQAEISNDVDGYKTLMILGNSSAGMGRRVSVWDRLEVNGMLVANGAQVNGTVESLADTVMGNGVGKRFILHTRTNGGGDFLQLTTDDGAGNWQWHQGLTFRRATGNVGISNVDPQDRLHVNGTVRILGDTNPLRFTSTWSGFPDPVKHQAEICNDTTGHKTLMLVGNQSAGMGRRVSVWDRFEVNGTFVNNSDARFKRNFRKLTGALGSVLRLEGLRYDLRPEDGGPSAEHQKDHIGFVAQQVREVCPELVSHDPAQDRYYLNYLGIVPLLVEAVKELRTGMEAELAAARARIAALEGGAA
ncbi:MAG TPA: tail fiber domain-containing protein [Longimicrobium sp.]|nr:tail fiber domain-containing protein [Longimicrobium sp.]